MVRQLGDRAPVCPPRGGDEAFAVLHQLGAANYADFVRADPAFASLHGDPRFDALLANAP